MTYVGDFRLESTFDVKFTTRRFTTGVPFALASGAISAYPDNSTTQLTAGITLSADFDGVTGLNNVRVVATNANGYAAGNWALVITTGTVDSVSVVGEVVAQFSIDARSALRPTTAGRTLDVDANGGAEVGSFQTGAITAAAFAAGAIDAAAIADNAIDAGALAANAITAAKIADGAIDAATFAADVDAEILSYVVDDATRIDASALNTATVTSIPAILADTGTDGVVVASINNNAITAAAIANGAIDAATFAAGAIDASAIAADAIGSSELAATAVTEIVTGVLAGVVEGTTTVAESLRLNNAAQGGKVAGGGTTNVTIRNLADDKNRVDATVDANGNRTAVTLDLT